MCFRIFFVLNRVRVSNPQGLTYTKNIGQVPPWEFTFGFVTLVVPFFPHFLSPTVNLLSHGVFAAFP